MGQIKNIKLHIVTDIKERDRMIHSVNRCLQNYDVHLASGSPRRRDILQHVGMKFSVTTSTFEENLDKNTYSHPREYAMDTAKGKALEVLSRLQSSSPPESTQAHIVIGADTVVVADGEILE